MKQKLQSMMYQFNTKMQKFMVGRYGVDELGRFASTSTLICLVLSMITKLRVLYWLGIFFIFYTYFRMFSRNIAKRYEENQKFIKIRYKITSKWSVEKKHFSERKVYRFFKCPQCKQKVRVPKGRGKICITCPKCNTEFVKKS